MPELTIERLQLFLIVVMPGIIAIKVYDLFHPPGKRDFGSSILEAVAYGLINLALWIWPILLINKKEFVEEYPFWYAVLSFCFLVVSPALLACLVVCLRNLKFVTSRIGYPTKTAWDDFFKRRRECFVLFHLKSKELVGGYFGPDSYAATFPEEPEILVEEVWTVDDGGKFLSQVPGTMGMVIKVSECERLEFLTVEREDTQNVQQGAGTSGNQGGSGAGQAGGT